MAGLYIHIPYCIKKCDYCDFVSTPWVNDLPQYIRFLKKELPFAKHKVRPDMRYETVFFGGGTPSLLDGIMAEELFSALHEHFDILPDAEITMECNPGTLTREKLLAYKRLGVNRLSIGMQSMDATCLKTIGRIHSPEDFLTSVQLAVDCGFTNINADVMHGLPGQTQESYMDTLEQLVKLPVTHVSSYALKLEPRTPLHKAVYSGKVSLPDEDAVADMEDAGIDFLEAQGFHRYEISNFAKPGYECRHNLNYWHNGEYLGIGVAAHSCLDQNGVWTRYSNMTNPFLYDEVMKLEDGTPGLWCKEIPKEEECFETVMLALRLVEGLDTEAFFERFGLSFYACYPNSIAQLENLGWCEKRVHGRFFRLNRRGLDMNNAALRLFLEEKGDEREKPLSGPEFMLRLAEESSKR